MNNLKHALGTFKKILASALAVLTLSGVAANLGYVTAMNSNISSQSGNVASFDYDNYINEFLLSNCPKKKNFKTIL